MFFAREYQSDFFPLLNSLKYESIYVTLTLDEKKRVEAKGKSVLLCFEEEYDTLVPADVPDDYFETSFGSDRYLGPLSLQLRREILGKEISFWRQALETSRATAVVNEIVAIEISEVLHLECRKRGIRYLSWLSFAAPNTFYFQHTPMHNQLDNSIQLLQPTAADVAKAEAYIEKVLAGSGQPFYAQNIKKRGNPVMLLKSIKRWMLTKISASRYPKAKSLAIFGNPQYVFATSIKLYFLSFFRKYKKLDDFRGFDLVFYPLHFEPEATLKYMSEFFSNQAATIEYISKCLKTNQVLVVKEHPQQPGMLLTDTFRRLQRNYSNILLLPAEIPTTHLIRECKAIVTLTSTAGFEGLIAGKPVFVLGKIFYNQCPGVHKIGSYEDLRQKLRSPEYAKPSPEQVKHFISQMVHYTHVGNPYQHASLYTNENIADVTRAIEEELKN